MWFRLKFRDPDETIKRWEPPVENPPAPFFKAKMRLSELEELTDLSDDDYLLVTDTSSNKRMKVKLSTLKEFIKS